MAKMGVIMHTHLQPLRESIHRDASLEEEREAECVGFPGSRCSSLQTHNQSFRGRSGGIVKKMARGGLENIIHA